MTLRLASAAAAVVLSLGALASPALARNAAAPAGQSAYAVPSNGGRVVLDDDDLTTGSVITRRGGDSAQEGNAEQNSFPVWQYGRTSGGPR